MATSESCAEKARPSISGDPRKLPDKLSDYQFNLKNIIQVLVEVDYSKLIPLAIELGLERDVGEIESESDPDQKRKRIAEKWLKNGGASWEVLTRALQQKSVKEDVLARDLKRRNTGTSTFSSLSSSEPYLPHTQVVPPSMEEIVATKMRTHAEINVRKSFVTLMSLLASKLSEKQSRNELDINSFSVYLSNFLPPESLPNAVDVLVIFRDINAQELLDYRQYETVERIGLRYLPHDEELDSAITEHRETVNNYLATQCIADYIEASRELELGSLKSIPCLKVKRNTKSYYNRLGMTLHDVSIGRKTLKYIRDLWKVLQKQINYLPEYNALLDHIYEGLPASKWQDDLVRAAQIDDEYAVKDILSEMQEKDVIACESDKYGWTPLMWVTNNGNLELVKLLLKKGANPNKTSKTNNWTSLMFASRNGFLDIAKALLDGGADANAQTIREGVTALAIAIYEGNTEIAKLLIDRGAAVNLPDNNGWTPLIYASKHGHLGVVHELCDKKANTGDKTKVGWSSLMLASAFGHTYVMKELVRRGANLNLLSNTGDAALHLAAGLNRPNSVKELADSGANMKVINKEGITALMLAAHAGYLGVLENLLLKGVDVNHQHEATGWTATFIAVWQGNVNIFKRLQQECAVMELQSGINLLDVAIYYNQVNVIKELTVQGLVTSEKSEEKIIDATSTLQSLFYTLEDRYYKLLYNLREHRYSKLRESPIKQSLLKEKNPERQSSIAEISQVTAGVRSIDLNQQDREHKSTEVEGMVLQGVEVCAETTVTVTNRELPFVWKEYGLKLHFQEGCLPEGVGQCVITIKASTAGSYNFPESHSLVSAVFWFCPEPFCKFTQPISVEIQHCGKQDDLSKLAFVKALCSQHTLPYSFRQTGQSGRFYRSDHNKSYGVLELNSFSGVAIAQQGSEDREYAAKVFYISQDISCNIHLVITWNDEAHLSEVKKKYREYPPREQVTEGPEQAVEFDHGSTEIKLEIPMCGMKLNERWKITPLVAPIIKKKIVESYLPGKIIPKFQLLAEFIGNLENYPADKFLQVNLIGAKEPNNIFQIKPPPPDISQVTARLQSINLSEQDMKHQSKEVEDEPIFDKEEFKKIAVKKGPRTPPDDLCEYLENFLSEVVVLLHTVKEEEMVAALCHLRSPVKQGTKAIRWVDGNVKITLGIFGGHKAALFKTGKGTESRDPVLCALRYLRNVKLIIGLGFACGLQSKCNLGDVLVSTYVDGVGNLRYERGEMKFDEGPVRYTNMSQATKNTFTTGYSSWKSFKCSKSGRSTEVVSGVLVSSPALLNDKDILEKYLKNNPRLIGGEMEGQELAHAQISLKDSGREVDFVVIKGVADFGDGTKEKRWQFTASLAAANYAEYMLQATNCKVYYCSEAEGATR